MAVFTDIFKAGTHEAERFLFRPSFYLVNTFYCFLVEDITANAIHGIGWITDNSSLLQHCNDLLNAPGLGILWINIEYHGFVDAKLSICCFYEEPDAMMLIALAS